MNNVSGYIESKIISYLINLHTGHRPIYFCRHGETEHNINNIIGGDSSLSELGINFSLGLSKFFNSELLEYCKNCENNNLKPVLYCSSLKRTIETSEILLENTQQVFNSYDSLKILDEINVGSRDGMSYDDIEIKFPKEYIKRKKNKLNYRYPQGESYMDVIQRIEPMIFEIERSKKPIIIIGHQAMLRCLYGYFSNVNLDEIPHIDMPLNQVIKFVPKEYGFIEEKFNIDPMTKIISDNNYNQDFEEGKSLYLIFLYLFDFYNNYHQKNSYHKSQILE